MLIHNSLRLALCCAFLARCGSASPDPVPPSRSGDEVPSGQSNTSPSSSPDPTQADPSSNNEEPKPATLILYVSNQSFEKDIVDISVTIDDVVVVTKQFAVENQHNFEEFELPVKTGKHSLKVVSSAGEASAVFDMTLGEKNWATVFYWYYPAEHSNPTAPSFTFDIQQEPILFL